MPSEEKRDRVRWLGQEEMSAWRAYAVGSALLEYKLNRELQRAHGLSMADYEILVLLSEQPEWRLRMSELALGVAHSKSRVSHQVRRLEAAHLVHRVSCPRDGRGVVAVLTDAGAELLRVAAVTHVAGVREHLVDLLAPAEQQTLISVFERVIERLRHSAC